MDRESIKLLQWCQLRTFINTQKDALSRWSVRILICLMAFMLTYFAIAVGSNFRIFVSVFRFPPYFMETIVIFILIVGATPAIFTSAAGLLLRRHEEDILLTMPISSSTIVQSRLLTIVMLAALPSLAITLFILLIEHASIRFDVLSHFLITFASVYLLLIISIGFSWVVYGLMKKYSLFENAVVAFATITTISFLVAFFWSLKQGPEAFGEFIGSPILKLFLIGPLVTAVVITAGSLTLSIVASLAALTGLALLSFIVSFSFEYELYEHEVSPYAGTVGRGVERESPPLPSWVEGIKDVVRIDYLDRGEGANAIFSQSYMASFAGNALKGPLVCLAIASYGIVFARASSSVMMEFHTLFLTPMFMLASLFIGVSSFFDQRRIDTDIIRLMPVEGRRKLVSIILPGIIQVGLCYVVGVVFVFALRPIFWAIFAFELLMLTPIMFLCGHVIGLCMTMSAYTAESRYAPEAIRNQLAGPRSLSPGSSAILFGPIYIMMIFFFVGLIAFDPSIIVVGMFLLGAFAPIVAYLLFERTAKNLDAFIPKA